MKGSDLVSLMSMPVALNIIKYPTKFGNRFKKPPPLN
jgi:hypothetical protein